MKRPKINDESFESGDRVRAYASIDGLTAAEQVLVDRWVPEGADVLDLGVGAGRTTPALLARARTYVGLDYSSAMVEAASRRFGESRFIQADAANLGAFAEGSFDVVMFSYNGLDYLNPYERRASALAEIHRVLRPAGVFIMSTHNPRSLVRRPTPGAPLIRGLASAAVMSIRAIRHRALTAATFRGSGYLRDHVQGLLTYFATPEKLLKELDDAGFVSTEILASDHPRRLHAWSTPWTYVAARPKPACESAAVTITLEAFPEVGSELAVCWDQLARQVGDGPFQTREWVEAWHKALEPTARIRVLVARREADIVGILPIARLTRPLHRRVRVPLRYTGVAGSGTGAADHLGPICAKDSVGEALLTQMATLFGDGTLLLENLAPRWAASALGRTQGEVLARTPCPVNVRSLDGSFADAWSTKARKNARRRERLMAQEDIVARWTSPGQAFPDALGHLRELHGDRWAAQGQGGLFPDQREELLKLYASKCSPDNGPWILTLSRKGRPVAALLGIRFRDSFSVYKTGWSSHDSRLGLGMALGQEAMRWSEQQGLHTFDYLRGPGSHKSELGCVPRHDVTILRAVGVSGKLLSLREDARHPVRSIVRHLRATFATS